MNEYDTESDFLRKFVGKDQRCLERIYMDNYENVQQYILNNSGKSEDAKDIFQEAIVAAWLNVKEGKFEVQSGKSLGGYIFQIAKFKWLDKLKSKEYRATIRLSGENHSLPDPQEDYGEEVELKMKYMNELYNQLDEKCKSILSRFYYENKSLAEIGEELKYSSETIKTLKYRCMKKLREFHIKNTP